jgi:hypothetical protein
MTYSSTCSSDRKQAFWIPDQTADADEIAKELLRKAGT